MTTIDRLNRNDSLMTWTYMCADCEHRYPIQVTPQEALTTLSRTRLDTCRSCGQRVGRGRVTCAHCHESFNVSLPHWHLECLAFQARCPGCGEENVGRCTCPGATASAQAG
jgi:hypothetical protein